jgi:predicted acetyltransferase
LSEFEDIRHPSDHDAVRDIVSRAFSMTQAAGDRHARWEAYRDMVGRENFRCLRRGDTVVASLCVYRMGQWWGGRAVPMGGVAAVGVAPEHRGTGAATEILTAQLRELHAQGFPLSVLYPATQRPYRKVGYEQAGSCCGWTLPLAQIGAMSRDLPCERISPDDGFLRGLHRLRGTTASGTLERNAAIWHRVLRERATPVDAYLLGTQEDPQGYVVFSHDRVGDPYDLEVRDVVALTPAAVARLWALLGDHRSVGGEAKWAGPSHEPLLTPLAEQRARLVKWERWMLRLVDVPSAFSERGYPAEVEGVVDLEVTADPVIRENVGRWQVQVSAGRAEVSPGGRGTLRASIGGLASLYAGFFRATELVRLGLVEASNSALECSDRLFSGPEPWMSDRF